MAKLTNNDIPTGPVALNTSNPFKPVHMLQNRVRMGLTGVTGAGKTFTALEIATALVPGGRIAVIDTEQGSAALYRNEFQFDHLNLTKYTPRYYITAINAAAANGYDVCIVDSLSPSWNGAGGILAIADGNIRGWKDATPEYQQLVQALINQRSKMHLIVTLRSKMKHELSTDPNSGRMIVNKVGLAPIHRDELPYELDIIGDIDQQHIMTFSKTRCSALDGRSFTQDGTTVAHIISNWLSALADNSTVAISDNDSDDEVFSDEMVDNS